MHSHLGPIFTVTIRVDGSEYGPHVRIHDPAGKHSVGTKLAQVKAIAGPATLPCLATAAVIHNVIYPLVISHGYGTLPIYRCVMLIYL